MDLIVGIGNEMRGDDGVGRRVIEAVPPRSGLVTVAVQQLLPELSETIHEAQRVLFVDAGLRGDAVGFDRIEPSVPGGVGHGCSPESLLGWVRLAYGAAPESWLLRIPGRSFEIGEGLSAATEAMIPEAIRRVQAWVAEAAEPCNVQ